jgi:hypothetical protein
MDKKSKILILAFICILIGSIYMLYKRSFIDQDFEVSDSSTELEEFN